MYIVTVPQVTIYLDKALADQVKAQDVPVSQVCQRALRQELAYLASGKQQMTHGSTIVGTTIRRQ